MPMPISHNAFDILQTDIAHSSRFRRTWKMRFLLKSTAGQLSWNQLISPLCTKHLGCTEVTSNSIVRHPYLSRSLIGRVKCPKANKQFLCVQYTILGNIHFLEWVGDTKAIKRWKLCNPLIDIWSMLFSQKIILAGLDFITLCLPLVYSLRLESDLLSYLTKAGGLDQPHPIITTPESDIFG